MEAKKTLLSTLMLSGLVLSGYTGLVQTQHQNVNSNLTMVAHANTTEGTIIKFSNGNSVVAKRDSQGNQIYDYVTKDGLSSEIPNTKNMKVVDKDNDALVLSNDIEYAVVESDCGAYYTNSLQGLSKNIAKANQDKNMLYYGITQYRTVGNTKIPVEITEISYNPDENKYLVSKNCDVSTENLAIKKDDLGKISASWLGIASPMTATLPGEADVTTADNGDVTIKFNPNDDGYNESLKRQDGTYTNNLLNRGKTSSNGTASSSSNKSSEKSSSSSLDLSGNEINTSNEGKDKVSRVITYSVQTPDGLKKVGSYTYNGPENQFNVDQVAQKNVPKGYKIIQMLNVPTVGADGSNDANSFTYLVEKSSDATNSSKESSISESISKTESSISSTVNNAGTVSNVNHSSIASSSSVSGNTNKSESSKDTDKNETVSKSSVSASSSVSKSDAKDSSDSVKGSSSVKNSSVVSSSENSQSMNSNSSVSSEASNESGLSKSISSVDKSSMSGSSMSSSTNKDSNDSLKADSVSSSSTESGNDSSVSDKDANSAVSLSSESVGSQSLSVIGQAGTAGQSGQNGGNSTMPEANTTNPDDGTTTVTSTTPADDTYSPQKAAMLAKTNAKAAQSGIIAAIGLAIGTVAGWFGLKKKNN